MGKPPMMLRLLKPPPEHPLVPCSQLSLPPLESLLCYNSIPQNEKSCYRLVDEELSKQQHPCFRRKYYHMHVRSHIHIILKYAREKKTLVTNIHIIQYNL